MKKFEQLLHNLDMKINGFTTYDNKRSFTILDLSRHLFHTILRPYKKRGWFGFCDDCGKFNRNLTNEVYDSDVDVDEYGNAFSMNIHGMLCNQCCWKLEDEREGEYGRFAGI